VAGDYHEGQLSAAMQRPRLVADAVDAWLKHAEGRPTLSFGVDRAYAQMLRDKFTAAGVAVNYIDGNTPMPERESIRRQFHSGDVQVVCSVGCLTTGVDWDVRCISLCRPTKSEMLYVQMIGRGLRTAPGKDHCLILDHSDTTLRLGFVTDIHHDVLDDGRKKSAAKRKPNEEALPKECPSCGALKRPRVRKCWSCGFEPKLISKHKHADGTLVEFAGRAPSKFDMATKQQWFSELLGIAKERGYRSGWVAHAFRSKFKSWPRGLAEVANDPSPQVRGYVRHLLIRHTKAQAKEAA
jgi:DNA repair protein RadD